MTDEANAPHLRPGDIAIINPTDREPAAGEMFVIDWQSGGSDIVETWSQHTATGCGPADEYIDTVCWKVGASSRPKSYDECLQWLRAGRSGGRVDGPYPIGGSHVGSLNKKLRGRVVGILAHLVSIVKLLPGWQRTIYKHSTLTAKLLDMRKMHQLMTIGWHIFNFTPECVIVFPI